MSYNKNMSFAKLHVVFRIILLMFVNLILWFNMCYYVIYFVYIIWYLNMLAMFNYFFI